MTLWAFKPQRASLIQSQQKQSKQQQPGINGKPFLSVIAFIGTPESKNESENKAHQLPWSR